MIDQVEIVNFQGHKYTLLDFSSGLNVIKGRSHSGKSSMMRAIEWALENRPRGAGDKFKRDYTNSSDDISISISFSEGSFITRIKNNNINGYITSEHEDPFVALRTDVPDEIREITKLRPHNMLSQRDKYFLIDKTPGNVSSELNKVVGLKIIDEKAAKAKKILTDLGSRLKVLDEQIKSTEEEINSPHFKIVKKIQKKLNKLDELIDTFDSETQNIADLIDIQSEIEHHKVNIRFYEKVKHFEPSLVVLNSLLDKLSSIDERHKSLTEIHNHITVLRSKIDKSSKLIKLDLKVVKLKEKIGDFLFVKDAIESVEEISNSITKEKKLVSKLSSEIDSLEKDKDKLESQLAYCTKCGALRAHWRKI